MKIKDDTKKSVRTVLLTLEEVITQGLKEAIKDRLSKEFSEELHVTVLKLFTPYFREKNRQIPVLEFRGIVLPVERMLDVNENNGYLAGWEEYSPLNLHMSLLSRILLADLKEAKGKEEKIRAVAKFLDELKEALKAYYDRHPFNRKTKIEGRLIEFLKEKVYLWSIGANEVGPAYTEPENFEPVWEGESLLDGETELRIYRHREYPVYFVAGGEFGMGAPNFGAVIVEPTEEEVELLKYLTFDQLRAVPFGANRIRKEGELFVIEANYCPETGLETYRLNPDEIADMIALERGYGSGGPEM